MRRKVKATQKTIANLEKAEKWIIPEDRITAAQRFNNILEKSDMENCTEFCKVLNLYMRKVPEITYNLIDVVAYAMRSDDGTLERSTPKTLGLIASALEIYYERKLDENEAIQPDDVSSIIMHGANRFRYQVLHPVRVAAAKALIPSVENVYIF